MLNANDNINKNTKKNEVENNLDDKIFPCPLLPTKSKNINPINYNPITNINFNNNKKEYDMNEGLFSINANSINNELFKGNPNNNNEMIPFINNNINNIVNMPNLNSDCSLNNSLLNSNNNSNYPNDNTFLNQKTNRQTSYEPVCHKKRKPYDYKSTDLLLSKNEITNSYPKFDKKIYDEIKKINYQMYKEKVLKLDDISTIFTLLKSMEQKSDDFLNDNIYFFDILDDINVFLGLSSSNFKYLHCFNLFKEILKYILANPKFVKKMNCDVDDINNMISSFSEIYTNINNLALNEKKKRRNQRKRQSKGKNVVVPVSMKLDDHSNKNMEDNKIRIGNDKLFENFHTDDYNNEKNEFAEDILEKEKNNNRD